MQQRLAFASSHQIALAFALDSLALVVEEHRPRAEKRQRGGARLRRYRGGQRRDHLQKVADAYSM